MLAVGHPALDFDGTPNAVDYTLKLRQKAVAGVLDDPAPVLRDLRVDQLPEMRFEPLVRPFFIRAHQARVPCQSAAKIAARRRAALIVAWVLGSSARD